MSARKGDAPRSGRWAWRAFLVVMVALPCLALWNLNRGVRAKAWEGECLGRRNGAVRAELQYYAAHRDYVSCGDRTAALIAARGPERLVGDDPTFHCLTSGLGVWIDEDTPPVRPEIVSTDRTRTGIWTEVARSVDGLATGFSVHTVCDPAGDGTTREITVTSVGAPAGKLIYQNATTGQAPWEMVGSVAEYLR